MADETAHDPFLQGKQAAEQGGAVTDNPHPEGSDEHARWREGHASLGPPDDVSEELGKFA